jgi:hypothetical protein
MSTRAHIEFIDEYGAKLCVDRSHDGFPDIIMLDIEKTIEQCRGKWSGSEIGQLVSYFLGRTFNKRQRIQDYQPCNERAGDESYVYFVKYNKESKEYYFGIY